MAAKLGLKSLWQVPAVGGAHSRPAMLAKSLALGAIAASLVALCGERHDLHAKAAVTATAPAHAPATTTSPEPKQEPIVADTVALLVIDGIRWQEIFHGIDKRLAPRHGISPEDIASAPELTPNLYRLRTQRGAAIGAPGVGPPMRASGPVYRSMPGYMELLSGMPARYCLSNRCGRVRHPTLLDDLVAATGEAKAAALFASWPHLVNAAALATERGVVSTGRNGGWHLAEIYDTPGRRALAEAARAAGPSPSKGDFRADSFTARLALDYLVQKRPRFLFLSVGEADAFGHSNNYVAYLGALRRSDAVVGEAMRITERFNLAGHRTTLIVTTDHGRDRNAREHGPSIAESGRVWLAASGYAVHRRGSVPSPTGRHLSDVAPAVRQLLGVSSAGPALSELFSD